MNIRTTIFLFALLALGLGLFALLQLYDVGTAAERSERDKWLFPTLKLRNLRPENIRRVAIERPAESGGKETLVFERHGDDWRMTSPRPLRTNSRMVEDLVFELIGLSRPLRPGMDKQPELQDADVTITLTLDEKKAADLGIAGEYQAQIATGGDLSAPILQVASSEWKTPVAVARNRLEKALAPIADYRARELLTYSESSLSGMKLKLPNRELAFTRSTQATLPGRPEPAVWRFESPALGHADRTLLADLASRAARLKVQRNRDFLHDGPLSRDQMDQYGLLLSGAVLAEITLTKKADGGEETLRIGRRTADSEALARQLPTLAAALAPPGVDPLATALGSDVMAGLAAAIVVQDAYAAEVKAGLYYAQLVKEESVVQIEVDHELLQLLNKGTDEFRDRRLAIFDRERLDAMNIIPPGDEPLRFRRTDLKKAESWELYYKDRPKVATHLDVVNRLLTDLNRVELNALEAGKPSPFLDDAAKQEAWFGGNPEGRMGFDAGQPQTVVELYVDGIRRDKDGKPADAEGNPLPADKTPILDDTKKPIRLVFGRHDLDRGVVYVRREIEGEAAAILAVPDPWTGPPPPPEVGMPPSSTTRVYLTSQVTQGYFAFRDHTLPSFPLPRAGDFGRDPGPTGIVRVRYQRGGEVYEIDVEEFVNDKGSRDERWHWRRPVQEKDAELRSRILSFLRLVTERVAADKLLSDQADDAEFARHGLTDQPFIKLAVTVQDKDKRQRTFTWYVGNLADPAGPQRNHFYARLAVESADAADTRANRFLFLLPWDQVQALDVELRNPVVFPPASASPEAAVLTWRQRGPDQKVVETRLELVFELPEPGALRKAWKVKSLTVGGVDRKAELDNLDQDKLNHLFDFRGHERESWPMMNPLQTLRYLHHRCKPAELGAGLDPGNAEHPPALVIELRMTGGTRTLIIGDRWEPKRDLDSPRLALTGPDAYFQAAAAPLPIGLFGFGEWLSEQLPFAADALSPPDRVFLLEESRFGELVSGWQFFRKLPAE